MKEKQIENQIKQYLKSKDIWYFKVWGGGYQTARNTRYNSST